MKRYIACVLALMAAGCISVSCGKSGGSDTASEAETTEAQEAVQPDPLAPKTTEETGDEQKVTSGNETETSTAASTDNTEPDAAADVTAEPSDGDTYEPETEPFTEQFDPLGGGAFVYDEGGAVVFEENSGEQDERVLLAAAQALFESACRTQWTYLFGMPYTVDEDTFIENDFGWHYRLITDPGVNSVADVRRDYEKVFSGRYPDELDDYYMDSNGRVYALCAKRGGDIYYSTSKITGIQSREGDEIVFTVENYYDGSDFEVDKAYTESDVFSVVIGSDDTWRVGRFRLPY